MEVERTNIFNRKDIDWERWVEALLWHQIVYHKNEYSGYDLMVKPLEINGEKIRGYEKGDIVGDITFLSYYIGETKRLTWKELALCLGFWKDSQLPDYHDCGECPLADNCDAYFKWDEDQERCGGWIEKCADKVPPIEEEYKKFIDRMMSPMRPGMVFTSLTKEEMDKFMKMIKEAE